MSHGWTALQRDDEAEDWGYLAVCGGCQSKQIEQARQRTSAPPAMEAATSGQLQDYAVETATGDAAQSGTEREQLEAVGREMGLTTQQIEQAKAEGVTSAWPASHRGEYQGRPAPRPLPVSIATWTLRRRWRRLAKGLGSIRTRRRGRMELSRPVSGVRCPREQSRGTESPSGGPPEAPLWLTSGGSPY